MKRAITLVVPVTKQLYIWYLYCSYVCIYSLFCWFSGIWRLQVAATIIKA